MSTKTTFFCFFSNESNWKSEFDWLLRIIILCNINFIFSFFCYEQLWHEIDGNMISLETNLGLCLRYLLRFILLSFEPKIFRTRWWCFKKTVRYELWKISETFARRAIHFKSKSTPCRRMRIRRRFADSFIPFVDECSSALNVLARNGAANKTDAKNWRGLRRQGVNFAFVPSALRVLLDHSQ